MPFFEECHKSIYQIKKTYPEKTQLTIDPFCLRWTASILKLGMLLQIFIDYTAKEISLEAIKCAWMVVKCAVISTCNLFERELSESEFQRKCRKIYEYIKKHDLVQHQDLLCEELLSGSYKEYNEIITTLLEKGVIISIPGETKSEDIYQTI